MIETEDKIRCIGIAHVQDDPWYMVSILLCDRMIKLTLCTLKKKRPKYYWYNKESFDYQMNNQDMIAFKWFFGLRIIKTIQILQSWEELRPIKIKKNNLYGKLGIKDHIETEIKYCDCNGANKAGFEPGEGGRLICSVCGGFAT